MLSIQSILVGFNIVKVQVIFLIYGLRDLFIKAPLHITNDAELDR